MKKKEMKKKEPVKLRQRELANGNYTLYLDIYWKGQRQYEYLNLYVKKSNKAADNEQNRQTLLLADQIGAHRSCLIPLQHIENGLLAAQGVEIKHKVVIGISLFGEFG